MVLHYRSAQFHVHKFILIRNSDYFGAHFRHLIYPAESYTSPPQERCESHPHIIDCVHLPERCGKVDVSVEQFRLFLLHLYFPQHYRCLPYQTALDNVDLTAQCALSGSCDWFVFASPQQLLDATSSVFFCGSAAASNYEVVSLCHFFGCARALLRAEHNMLLVLSAIRQRQGASECADKWACWRMAVDFDLQRVRKAILPRPRLSKDEWELVVEQQLGVSPAELMQFAN